MSATDALTRRTARDVDPYRLGRGHDARQATGAMARRARPSKHVVVAYGFWIFLLSDIVMFSAFFAAHAVLQTATADGPSGRELVQSVKDRDRNRLPARCRASPAACRRWRRRRATSSGRRSRCW